MASYLGKRHIVYSAQCRVILLRKSDQLWMCVRKRIAQYDAKGVFRIGINGYIGKREG